MASTYNGFFLLEEQLLCPSGVCHKDWDYAVGFAYMRT